LLGHVTRMDQRRVVKKSLIVSQMGEDQDWDGWMMWKWFKSDEGQEVEEKGSK
jgi:hypothetical protein